MTPTEINKAIAEACGWTHVSDDNCMGLRGSVPRTHRAYNTSADLRAEILVPNFSASLDAMAEARKTLNDAEQELYADALIGILYDSQVDYETDRLKIINATSQQHAEAFLKEKGSNEPR